MASACARRPAWWCCRARPISSEVVTCLNEPSLHGEHPDRPPLRHIRILAGEDQVHARLHFRGVAAPAGLHRDVLLAVDLERSRHPGNARAGRELPQDLAGPGVERAEHAVVGAAREQQSAAGGEYRTPIERRQVGRPNLFAGIEIPGLQLADVVGAGNHLQHVFSDAHETLASDVFRGFAGELGAEVVVGGDVEHPRLRAVRGRRPILAAPQARTELGALVGARLARLIDLGPSGPGIEPLEHVLAHVGLAGDELDLAVGALELPEIAVARDVDEALHASPVATVVDDQRRRDFVPIPGVVGMILEVSPDLPGAGAEGDDRGGEQIVAGTLIAEPWAAVAGAPESQIGLGVIGTRDPDRRAAPLMMVAARGPGLAAGLTRGWHRIGLPELLAGLRIEGREEAAHAQFTADAPSSTLPSMTCGPSDR